MKFRRYKQIGPFLYQVIINNKWIESYLSIWQSGLFTFSFMFKIKSCGPIRRRFLNLSLSLNPATFYFEFLGPPTHNIHQYYEFWPRRIYKYTSDNGKITSQTGKCYGCNKIMTERYSHWRHPDYK